MIGAPARPGLVQEERPNGRPGRSMAPPSLRSKRSSTRSVYAAVAVVVATTPLLVAFTGSWVAALVPVVAVSVVWLLWQVPLDTALPLVVFAVLTFDDPQEGPGRNLAPLGWRPPLAPLGKVVFTNIGTLVPGAKVPFSVLDLCVVLLVVRALIAPGARGRSLLTRAGGPPVAVPRTFVKAVLLSIGAIAMLEVYGMAGHGSFKDSLWQIRAPLDFGLIALATAAAGTTRLVPRLERVVLAAATIKALITIYAYWVVAKSHDFKPDYVGTHSDSAVYVLALIVLLSHVVEGRMRRNAGWFAATGAILGMAIYANNRRLAWVCLLGALAWLFTMTNRRFKRKTFAVVLIVWPALVGYVGLGLHSSSGVFYPVRAVNSVIYQDDSSSRTRQIEDYNLWVTYRSNPIIGHGFGHKYIEASKGDDISKAFPQYRYLPHNSLLGFIAFNGVLGFAAFWTILVVGICYASAALRLTRRPELRSAALWAVGGLVIFMVQAHGDVGLQSSLNLFVGAVGCGMAVAVHELARTASTSGPTPAPADPGFEATRVPAEGGASPIDAVATATRGLES